MRGLKLDDKKASTLVTWTIKRSLPPNKVVLSCRQYDGQYAKPVVQIGEKVFVGDKIADATQPYHVPLFASLSGQVTAIEKKAAASGGEELCIEITSEGRDEKVSFETIEWEHFSGDEILERIQNAGIIGLSGSGMPVHAKIKKAKTKPIDLLIINACESEPYATSEHALMMSHPLEILKGAEMLRRALSAREVVIATEDNKLEPAELLKSKIFFLRWQSYRLQIFPSKYPQGAEEVLVPAVLAALKNPKENNFAPSVYVQNISTTYAIYEAVALGKPFYERAVTVGGECVAEAKNAWVRNGMMIPDILKIARGLLREPGALVMGGPMRGDQAMNVEAPVASYIKSVLALPKEIIARFTNEPCIFCGLCKEVCPVDVEPSMIGLAMERGVLEKFYIEESQKCIGCGNCSFICPAKRTMRFYVESAARAFRGLVDNKLSSSFKE